MSQPPGAQNRKWPTILLVYAVGIATALLYVSIRSDEWPDGSLPIPPGVPEKKPLILKKAPEGSYEQRANTAISAAIRLIGKNQEWKQSIETTNCRISVTSTENESWLIEFEQLPVLPYISVKVAVDSEGTPTLSVDET